MMVVVSDVFIINKTPRLPALRNAKQYRKQHTIGTVQREGMPMSGTNT